MRLARRIMPDWTLEAIFGRRQERHTPSFVFLSVIKSSSDDYRNPIQDYRELIDIKSDILLKFQDGRDLLVIPKSMKNEIIKAAHKKGH